MGPNPLRQPIAPTQTSEQEKVQFLDLESEPIYGISDFDYENGSISGASNFSAAENSFHEENGEVGGEESDVNGRPDGWSDVNEENISEELVREMGSFSDSDCDVERVFRGRAFKLDLYWNIRHFKQVIFYYFVQEGFMLKRIKNKIRIITCGCRQKVILGKCMMRTFGQMLSLVLFCLRSREKRLADLDISTAPSIRVGHGLVRTGIGQPILDFGSEPRTAPGPDGPDFGASSSYVSGPVFLFSLWFPWTHNP
ncbi:hypothetical protein ACOSQ4_016616 [Xanthoceras sorbifolium]